MSPALDVDGEKVPSERRHGAEQPLRDLAFRVRHRRDRVLTLGGKCDAYRFGAYTTLLRIATPRRRRRRRRRLLGFVRLVSVSRGEVRGG